MTDTDTKAKAPPTWMKRDPLSAMEAATVMNRLAGLREHEAALTSDPDVRAGLRWAVHTLTEARDALNGGRCTGGLIERLEYRGRDALACASATTEPTARTAYMDDAHAYREAVRHLKATS